MVLPYIRIAFDIGQPERNVLYGLVKEDHEDKSRDADSFLNSRI
jgi:hypothetical protein